MACAMIVSFNAVPARSRVLADVTGVKSRIEIDKRDASSDGMHVYYEIGDKTYGNKNGWKSKGLMISPISGKKIETIKIKLSGKEYEGGIKYQVLCQGSSKWKTFADGKKAGTAQKRLEAIKQFQQDALERGDVEAYLEYEQQVADLEVEIQLNKMERSNQINDEATANQKQAMKERIDAMQWAASNTSSILNSIADMYDANSEGNKKNAQRAKNLRIAGAIIDTISGAVTALATAQQLGPIAGPIVGAVNAAAITAAGIANVMKIRQTPIDGSSSGGSTASPTVSAPRIDVGPQQTTVVQGDQAEDRLNRMAQDQRVYILQSDIEAAGNTSKVQVAESSF